MSQREYADEARRVSAESAELLRPLHDELTEYDAYDGVVLFLVDGRRADEASAVVGLRPNADNAVRHEFYDTSIDKRRIDLGATALGAALRMSMPEYLPSRMNHQHTTWGERLTCCDQMVGGLQVAFRKDLGALPSERALHSLNERHNAAVAETVRRYHELEQRVDSLADALEFDCPVTPNACIIGWDISDSTNLIETRPQALMNYVATVGDRFYEIAGDEYVLGRKDTGDGDHIVLWLPDSVDRADKLSVGSYLKSVVIPMVNRMRRAHEQLVEDGEVSIAPEVRFAVGVGSLDKDKQRVATGAEFWRLNDALDDKTHSTTLALTAAARQLYDVA